jgi:hypothetical protein
MNVDEYKDIDTIPEDSLYENYSSAIKGISDIRNLTYKVFFAMYSRDNPEKSIAQITDDLIQTGIDKFCKEMKHETTTFEDVCSEFQQYYPTQTNEDIKCVLMDHGLGQLCEKYYGEANSFRFVEKYGDILEEAELGDNNERYK